MIFRKLLGFFEKLEILVFLLNTPTTFGIFTSAPTAICIFTNAPTAIGIFTNAPTARQPCRIEP